MMSRNLLPLLASLTLVCLPVSAQDVESKLLKRIDQAQTNLANTQRTVTSARNQLVNQLNKLEREVLDLEEKAAVARRLEDEKTLSLKQLQARLDTWQQQHLFQQNLLTRFLRRFATNDISNSASLSERIIAVGALSEGLTDRIQPRWKEQQIILDSGEIQTLPTLRLGPATWYWNSAEQRAGIAQERAMGLKSALVLDSDASAQIKAVLDNNSGMISFDPTLGRALARELSSDSVYEHISKGGMWVIPILLAASLALGIALLKSVQLWRLPKIARLSPSELQGILGSSVAAIPATIRGVQRNLLDISLHEPAVAKRDDQLFNALGEAKARLDYGVGAIAITAAISPLLGLLGTVSGMIQTFEMMTLFGSSDPEVVSGGIAQALVTTELGLIVAIPALILHALLNRWVKSYYADLEAFAISISQVEAYNPAESAVAPRQAVTHKTSETGDRLGGSEAMA